MLYEVTDDNFQEQVVESGVPCLIQFTGSWCTLCEQMAPMLEELAEEYDGRIKFCTVDTDTQRKLRIKFAVAALPYLVLVADGNKTPLFDELVTKERLRNRIDLVLAEGGGPTTRPL